jgi:sugar O-acyltransferase (sialic acid O-acetyltransferase NeuD family)
MPTDALLIFGAGGHGRVVADAARAAGATGLLASDRNPTLCHGELLPGIPLHRPDTPAPAQATALHVAIGHNAARERESQALGPQRLRTVCHPAASVSPFAQLGAGSFVAAQAVVAPGARLGLGVIVNHAAVVDHDCRIGDFAHIAPGAVLGGQVHIGERVLVGSGAVVQPSLSVVADVIIGSGAVVCRNIDTAGTYVGIPARRIL